MRQATNDIILAAGLLTRLPLPRLELDGSRTAQASWAWPLVGAVVGCIGAAVGAGAMAVGLPPLVAATLTLIAMGLSTGGLHEDGLADTADGLWGGHTRERRLEIMRDSRVGAYGMIAICLMLILRVAVIAALAEAGALLALIAAASLSRAAMAGMMAAMPPARNDGLSKGSGRPGPQTVAVAIGLAAVATVLCGLPLISWPVGLAVLVWLGLTARSKIGGQTGDILGAGCLLSETAALMAAI